MRWIKRGLLSFAGLIALLAFWLVVLDRIEAAQSEKFYAARPMLREMRDAPPHASLPNDPWPQYRAILLAHVPVGTTRLDALRILSSQGIVCEVKNFPPQRLLVCGATQRPAHVTRWYVELAMSPDDNVTSGRVLALKATA